MLWEQAFWGALGGVTFSNVMNKAGEFINKRLDKDWTSAENKERMKFLVVLPLFKHIKKDLIVLLMVKIHL